MNLALSIIKRHVQKQPNLFVYTYERKSDQLTPITWKTHGITNPKEDAKSETNNWGNIGIYVDYTGG